MRRVEKEQQLIGFEKVKKIHLHSEDFTIENGLLTTTMKLKRVAARNMFQKMIDAMYAQKTQSKL